MFYPLNLFSVPPQAHVNRQAGGCFRQRFVMDPLVYYLTNYDDDDDDDFDDDGDEAFQFAWSKLTARVA